MAKNLYFVTARQGWETVFGGHWYAETPKKAIEIAQQTITSNETGIGSNSCDGLTFKATKSKATYNALNKAD